MPTMEERLRRAPGRTMAERLALPDEEVEDPLEEDEEEDERPDFLEGFLENMKLAPPILSSRALLKGAGGMVEGLGGGMQAVAGPEVQGPWAAGGEAMARPMRRLGELMQAGGQRVRQALTDETVDDRDVFGLVTKPFQGEMPEPKDLYRLYGALFENLPNLMAAGGATAMGGPVAGMGMMSLLEGGSHYNQLRASGIPEETARAAAAGVGTINASLEVLPIMRLLKRIPGVNAKELLRNGVVQAALEGGTEGVQEYVGLVSEHITEGDVENVMALQPGELKRILEAGGIGALLGFAAGGAMSGSGQSGEPGKVPAKEAVTDLGVRDGDYDSVQAKIDAEETRLESLGEDIVRLVHPDSDPKGVLKGAEGYKPMESVSPLLADLYSLRWRIEAREADQVAEEAERVLTPLIPDPQERKSFAREITEADRITALRNTDEVDAVVEAVNKIAHRISGERDIPQTAFAFTGEWGGTARDPVFRLRLESERGLGPSDATLEETQRWVGTLFPHLDVKIPGASSRPILPPEEIAADLAQTPPSDLPARLEAYTEMIEEGGKARLNEIAARGKDYTPKDLFQDAADALIDKNLVINRVKRATRGKELKHLMEEIPYLASEQAAHVYELNEQMIRPLREAGISDAQMGVLMGLERASTERADIESPLGESGARAAELEAYARSQLTPEQVEVVDRARSTFHELRQRNVIDVLEESGALSAQTIENARNNPHYVRFEVLDEVEESLSPNSRSGGALRAFKEQVGTARKIGNPLLETMLTDMALLRLAQRSKAAIAAVESWQEVLPDEISKAKRGAVQRDETGAVVGAGRILDHDDPHVGTLYYIQDGKAKGAYVPKRLADAFESDEAPGATWTYYQKLVVTPMREILVNRNPAFIPWNIARDNANAWKNIYRGDPLTSSVKTLYYLAKNTPDAFNFVYRGKASPRVLEALRTKALLRPHQRVYTAMDETEQQATDAVLDMFDLSAAAQANRPSHKRAMAKFWEWFDRLPFGGSKPGELSERMTKLAAYDYLKANQAKFGMSDQEIAHDVRSKVGTPDVMRRGKAQRFTNSIFLFSNVGKEGWRSSVEAARQHPIEYAAKTAAQQIVSKGVLMAAAYGMLGDEMKEVVRRIPEFYKRGYSIIPWGLDKNDKAVFTAFPLDHTGQAISGFAYSLFEDEKKVQETLQTIGDVAPWSLQKLHPYIQAAIGAYEFGTGMNPTDYYRHRPAIPSRLFERNPRSAESKAAFYQWLFSKLGGNVFVRFDSETLDSAKSELEEALEFPVAGNVLSRFLRTSDYGLQEEARARSEKIRLEKADIFSRRDKFLAEAHNMDASDSEARLRDLHNAMKQLGVAYDKPSDLKRRWKQLHLRSGSAIERSMSYAGTRAERFAIAALEKDSIENLLETELKKDPKAQPLRLWRMLPPRQRQALDYSDDFLDLVEDAKKWVAVDD